MSVNTVSLEKTPQAWWRFGMVWLVLAGPAAVIVAGFVTLWLAVNTTDTVLPTQEAGNTRAQAPAVQARNHALTPAGGAAK